MADLNVERHIAELEEDAYTIVPEVMSPSEIEATKRAIEESMAAEEELGRKLGTQTEDLRVVYEAQGKHPHFYGLVLRNPEPLHIARRILGDDMVCYSLALRNPMPTGRKDMTKHGGHFHVDASYFTVTPFVGGNHYTMAIQSAWCVSDFTKQSGGTLIWPRSHLSLEAPYRDSETVPPGHTLVEAPAGAVIMWDSASPLARNPTPPGSVRRLNAVPAPIRMSWPPAHSRAQSGAG